MAAIASSTRASLPPPSPATQQPPSIAPHASFARLFRSKGSHETRLGPLPHSTATRRSTIVPPVSAVAESRNPARSFSCSPSTSPPQINDSLHSDNATSLLVIPTLATVTTLSALIAPSAVAAVTGADVNSVAEAAAAAGAAVGTAGDGALASLSQLFLLGALSLADEPSNALSLPTWIIHGGGDGAGVAIQRSGEQEGVEGADCATIPGGGDGTGVAVRGSGEPAGMEGARMGHGAAAHGGHVRVHVALLLQFSSARGNPGLQLVPCRVLFCDAVEGPRMGHGASSYGGHVRMLVVLLL
ncbi:unnamed protein product [Closterium sp. Naga37s-1]|nr:unnamed protein product [Closterium sp. Naga37s-1]